MKARRSLVWTSTLALVLAGSAGLGASPAQALVLFPCALTTTVINGTPGDDLLIGTPGNDLINGMGGNDVIIGNGGADTIYGGAGNDRLYGSDGSDCLFGGNGDDYLSGAGGNDGLWGEAGKDDIEDWTGANLLDGGADVDYCIGDSAYLSTYVSCEAAASKNY